MNMINNIIQILGWFQIQDITLLGSSHKCAMSFPILHRTFISIYFLLSIEVKGLAVGCYSCMKETLKN